MPGIDGIEATRRIVADGLAARVLVLTTFQHDEYVWGALRAGQLVIAESTAKTHVKRILAKIGARDRAQAVVIAYQSGLFRP
jgi:DNA-binding NarL/FixJ family response regulator